MLRVGTGDEAAIPFPAVILGLLRTPAIGRRLPVLLPVFIVGVRRGRGVLLELSDLGLHLINQAQVFVIAGDFGPSVSVMLMEKNAMANDMANRECASPPSDGRKLRRSRSSQLSCALPDAVAEPACIRLVEARMLWTRFFGGSNSSSPRTSSMPSRASASNGPQTLQLRPCAAKAACVPSSSS